MLTVFERATSFPPRSWRPLTARLWFPAKLARAGTNADVLTHEFIAEALPKRKYLKDGLFPCIILKLVNYESVLSAARLSLFSPPRGSAHGC